MEMLKIAARTIWHVLWTVCSNGLLRLIILFLIWGILDHFHLWNISS
jgi:hypothetical protein